MQAVGHIPVDVNELQCDMLSLSAHKFHGPRGVGALYCRKTVLLQNLIEGGAQERGRRAGTENLPAIAAMAVALENAVKNIDKNNQYVSALRDKLIGGLSEIEKSIVNGDINSRLAGNVNICFVSMVNSVRKSGLMIPLCLNLTSRSGR